MFESRTLFRFSGLRLLLLFAVVVVATCILSDHARAVPVDVCAKVGTLANVVGLYGISQPANEPDAEDYCTITITDFTFAQRAEFTFLEPDIHAVSDILSFQNTANNQAMICFESDPIPTSDPCKLTNPNPTVDFIRDVFEVSSGSTALAQSFQKDGTLGGNFLSVTGKSDCDGANCSPIAPFKNACISDTLEIQGPAHALQSAPAVVCTPEPSVLPIFGAGLLGLGALSGHLARRVRRSLE